MKRYKDVLSRFVAADFGDAVGVRPADAEALLRQDLQAVMTTDTKYFNLCIGLVVLLFVGSVIFVIMNREHPAIITGIFGLTGLSSAALLKQIIDLWRERSHSEVAYILATKLPPEDLKAIIAVLLGAKQ